MKPITQDKTTIKEPRTTAATPDVAAPQKATAQCCAKVSRVTMGCHN